MSGKKVSIHPLAAYSETSILNAMSKAEGEVLRWLEQNKDAEIISIAPACWVDNTTTTKEKYSCVFTVTYKQ